MLSMAPNIVFAPNITQNAEHRHRTQDTNTAHFRTCGSLDQQGDPIITSHKRSWGKVMFYYCLSFRSGEGGFAVQGGAMKEGSMKVNRMLSCSYIDYLGPPRISLLRMSWTII